MALRLEQVVSTSVLEKTTRCSLALPSNREDGDTLLAIVCRSGSGEIRQLPPEFTTLAQVQSENSRLTVWMGTRIVLGDPDQYEVIGGAKDVEWDVALLHFKGAGIIAPPIFMTGVGRPDATGITVPANSLVFSVLCNFDQIRAPAREVPLGSELVSMSRHRRPSGIAIARVYDTPEGVSVANTQWSPRVDGEFVCSLMSVPPGVGRPEPAEVRGRQVIHAVRFSNA